MKVAFFIAGFAGVSCESMDITVAVENLRSLNDWVENNLFEQGMVATKIGNKMEEWQTNLQDAFRAGASRGDLSKLLLAGRRLRLDLMIDYETGRYSFIFFFEDFLAKSFCK